MPLNDTVLNIGVTAMQTAIAYIQIHTALPNSAGSNEATSARVATGWPAAANGDFGTLSNKLFTGGAPSGPALYLGYWSASSGGTFYGYQQLVGDQQFNSAGQYTLTSLTIPGTAT
jgi:hypothetical protein